MDEREKHKTMAPAFTKKGKIRDLKDILFIPADTYGVGMHQCYYPSGWINEARLASSVALPPRNFDLTHIAKADIIILQRQVNPDGAKVIANFMEQATATVMDIDDNFWDIPSTHQLKSAWPPDKVHTLNKMCEAADGVTVHSNGLEKIIADKFPELAHKLYRMPALANFTVKPIKKKRKMIRIGWVGAVQHKDDISPAIHAVINLMRKRDNIMLVTMGIMDHTIESMIPWYRRETYNFVPSDQFQSVLATLDIDIALAPVDDAGFHVGQSARKYIDYSTIKACTIARKAPPYSNENLDSAPIYWVKSHKVPEWYRVIDEVIEAGKWKETGREAFEYCKKHFGGPENVHKWVDIYSEIFTNKQKRLIDGQNEKADGSPEKKREKAV